MLFFKITLKVFFYRGSFPSYDVPPSLVGYDSRPLILQYAEQKYVSIF